MDSIVNSMISFVCYCLAARLNWVMPPPLHFFVGWFWLCTFKIGCAFNTNLLLYLFTFLVNNQVRIRKKEKYKNTFPTVVNEIRKLNCVKTYKGKNTETVHCDFPWLLLYLVIDGGQPGQRMTNDDNRCRLCPGVLQLIRLGGWRPQLRGEQLQRITVFPHYWRRRISW